MKTSFKTNKVWYEFSLGRKNMEKLRKQNRSEFFYFWLEILKCGQGSYIVLTCYFGWKILQGFKFTFLHVLFIDALFSEPDTVIHLFRFSFQKLSFPYVSGLTKDEIHFFFSLSIILRLFTTAKKSLFEIFHVKSTELQHSIL